MFAKFSEKLTLSLPPDFLPSAYQWVQEMLVFRKILRTY